MLYSEGVLSFSRVTDLLTGAQVDADQTAAPPPSPLSVDGLRVHAQRPAVVAGDRVLVYAELADLVDDRRREIGQEPQLVVLHGANSLDFVVTYLAALEGRHPIIVAPNARAATSLRERFAARVWVDATSGHDARIHRCSGSSAPRRVAWHSDLAVLLSTSGSTGSPKLVRLSREAIDSNATAIAQSLGLRADDRAITSLPLHYCYGLSVVTSHLAVGGSVVLTDASVVDPCFRSAVRDHGVTTLAGVPHTFDMMQRLADDVLAAPSLRMVTQAGGAMKPETVARLADIGVRSGWDLVVMYGQTEATARMAVQAPGSALEAPASVGVAIPGGDLRLDPVAGCDDDIGEVVYSGPNVMMGYATSADDLRRGRDLTELHTGDLGRFDPSGRLEIVGRLNRFVKLHGKRIDLDHLEHELDRRLAVRTRVVGDDDGVVAALLDSEADGFSLDAAVAAFIADFLEVPHGRVLSLRTPELPRTASGKLDSPAVIHRARTLANQQAEGAQVGGDATVADSFSTLFGRRPRPEDTFAALGGDSFSYVEMSIRLEAVLGSIPADWHLRPVAELEALREQRPGATWWSGRTRSVETSVVIRAVGIMLIVCTHMGIFRLAGGAHALLAVAGYNVARFQLLPHDMPDRARRIAATIARVAVPTSVWIGLNMLIVGGYSMGAVLLVNNYTGSGHRTDGRWEYWYFEAFVQIMIVIATVFSFRRVRQAERARPFGFAIGALGVTWLFRFEIVNLGGAYNEIFRPHTIACFLVLGWCAQRATTTLPRLLVSALAMVTTLGYFETVGRVDQMDRELRILAAVLALVWIRSVRVPTPVAAVIGAIAAASMWIFLVHWQVWPLFTLLLDDRAAYLATIGVGVAVWWGAGRVSAIFAAQRQRRIEGRSTSSQVSNPDTAMSSSDATPVSA